ncbi:MAG: hypothetical protein P4L63_01965 [Candidatus Pacebacteria bacterium]|nr:hypothetical protein [Candidatus Paceibacterota bacterium]
MDQNFQTSFIPKKPIVEERVTSSQPIGIFMIAAIAILFIVLIGTGGIFFYKKSLENKIVSLQTSLNNAQNSFEPTKISELQLLDKRLNAATEVLDNHIAVSPIFTELENITMHTIRYTQFGYTLSSGAGAATASAAGDARTGTSGNIDVKMSGTAIDYRSIALESDLFSQDKNFINPVFSNLTVDSSGNITFDLEFYVVPSFVNYKQTLAATPS